MPRRKTFSSPSDPSYCPKRRGRQIKDNAKEQESVSSILSMKLCKDQLEAAAMRHDLEGINVAYAKVYPETIAERGIGILRPDKIQLYLDNR
jgi:hypothetical protein